MTAQVDAKIEIPMNGIGNFRKVRDPTVLDDVLSKMQDSYVLCEFLNRTVGGITYSLLPKKTAQERYNSDHSRWDASDEKLMAIYTREDVLRKKEQITTYPTNR